mgnify:CR=1 FL=1
MAHQLVAGKSTDPALGGSEGVSTQSVGLVEKIGCDCFEPFDYVALGHIHSPQSIERDTIRYSGSILKYSLSEATNQKSAPLITLGEKGDIDIELLPLLPMRDLRHIAGPMEKLLAKENVESTDDYIYVTLTDEEIINDAYELISSQVASDSDPTHFCSREEFEQGVETLRESTKKRLHFEGNEAGFFDERLLRSKNLCGQGTSWDEPCPTTYSRQSCSKWRILSQPFGRP